MLSVMMAHYMHYCYYSVHVHVVCSSLTQLNDATKLAKHNLSVVWSSLITVDDFIRFYIVYVS